MNNPLLTNKITALFMGETDLLTGKWFPWQKMTWEAKKGTNYINLKIEFLEGAKEFQKLYPKSENVVDYGRVMNYRDISYSPWRNRMPLSRPPKKIFRELYRFNLEGDVDPIEYAVISGGYRMGDKCDIFPEVAPDEQGNYNFVFIGRDACGYTPENKSEIEAIPVGAKVNLHPPKQKEIQKGEWIECTAPPEAIRMKMFAEGKLVGYAPPFIKDLHKRFGEDLQVTTCAKNLGLEFDYQFTFIFKATINKAIGIPFSEERYQPFTSDREQPKSVIYG